MVLVQGPRYKLGVKVSGERSGLKLGDEPLQEPGFRVQGYRNPSRTLKGTPVWAFAGAFFALGAGFFFLGPGKAEAPFNPKPLDP